MHLAFDYGDFRVRSGEQTIFLKSVVYFINPSSTTDSLNHFVGSKERMRVPSVDAKHRNL